ncbi:MAG: ACT domain-containing protein, partial [Acidobacteriota bacterium]
RPLGIYRNLTRVRVVLRTDDRKGVLARITSTISEEGTNISNVEARVSEEREATVLLVLEVTDKGHLEKVLRRLRQIDGIRRAERHVG